VAAVRAGVGRRGALGKARWAVLRRDGARGWARARARRAGLFGGGAGFRRVRGLEGRAPVCAAALAGRHPCEVGRTAEVASGHLFHDFYRLS
jgi:hypothetical protein